MSSPPGHHRCVAVELLAAGLSPCCFLAFERRNDIANAPRVNDKIRASEMRLVAPDGSQIGIKGREEALWLAQQLGLDLVEVAPEAKPPVARLMDYGKFKYEQSVRDREARKNSTKTVIKEVKFRPKIDVHDYETKKRRVEEFLGDRDKVKITMMFRGREVTHPELGRDLLTRLAEDVAEFGTVETPPKLEGRNMTMLLVPTRRQKGQKNAETEDA